MEFGDDAPSSAPAAKLITRATHLIVISENELARALGFADGELKIESARAVQNGSGTRLLHIEVATTRPTISTRPLRLQKRRAPEPCDA